MRVWVRVPGIQENASERGSQTKATPSGEKLLEDLNDDASTYRAAAFADRKTQPIIHRNR